MCPTGLKLYARSDSLLGGLRWRLHTARCPSCAEYRSAERELDAYIAMISETEIRSLRGASARARLTVSPSAAMSDGQQRARRRKITMTRLAYVLTLVIAVALLLGGILYKSPPPDGRSLLIGAAQAMEEVHVIHTRGWNESFRTRPAGAVAFGRSAGAVGSRGSFDHWLSTKGSRYQFFDKRPSPCSATSTERSCSTRTSSRWVSR
jgi:hypothetical protein